MAIKSLEHLQTLGIVEEITGRERHRKYIYKKYLDILNDGISDFDRAK